MAAEDSVKLQKFKDGVQDTVVFLRMLEQFKIPAVMETRRKKLLEKLLYLQGERVREKTPPSSGKEAESRAAGREREKTVKELTRVGSTVESRMKEYEKLECVAKKEREQYAAKRISATPSISTANDTPETMSPVHAPVNGSLEAEESTEEKVRSDSMLSAASAGVCESDTTSLKDEGSEKEDGEGKDKLDEPKKKKKKKESSLTILKGRFKKSKKKQSPDVSQNTVEESKDDDVDAKEEHDGEVKGEGEEGGAVEAIEEEEEEVELEEGVKLQSSMEKRVPKRFGGTSWVPITVKLKETTMILCADKKEKVVDLSESSVSKTEETTGLEVCCHLEQKQWVLRVKSEAQRDRWVQEVQEAIETAVQLKQQQQSEDQATLPEDEEAQNEEVPSITVELAKADEEEAAKTPKKRLGFSSSPRQQKKSKALSEVPEQGIQKRGYVHRKKGTFGAWEKKFCVVTFTAMYFTTGEDMTEYHHMYVLGTDGHPSVKIEKKGHDKHSASVVVKYGRSKEVLSVPVAETDAWKNTLEDVLGLTSTNLEFASDEELEDEKVNPEPIVEDIYDEFGNDEFEIDEEIYEEFDEAIARAPESIPSLPPRNENKASPYEPGPALPPRNKFSTPTLPPRGSLSSPASSPKGSRKGIDNNKPAAAKFITKTAPSKPPLLAPEELGDGEEIYDDILGAEEELEELYEDVVTPQSVNPHSATLSSHNGVPSFEDEPEEEYAEMTLSTSTDGPTEEYVLMEKDEMEEEEVEQELYCEVDPDDAPSHAVRRGAPVTSSPQLPVKGIKLPPKGIKPTPAKVGGIVKPPPPATYISKVSGKLSHKAPNKTRFYEEWGKLEGTNLCMFKSQNDKSSGQKITLSDYDMLFGPMDGHFAFRLTSGKRVHTFNLQSKDELSRWVRSLRDMTKSASLEVPKEELPVYQAAEDHEAASVDQISFCSGTYIRIISEGPGDWWVGQVGSSSDVFDGKIGKFPSSKVMIAEDVYI